MHAALAVSVAKDNLLCWIWVADLGCSLEPGQECFARIIASCRFLHEGIVKLPLADRNVGQEQIERITLAAHLLSILVEVVDDAGSCVCLFWIFPPAESVVVLNPKSAKRIADFFPNFRYFVSEFFRYRSFLALCAKK